jgi:predicted porin
MARFAGFALALVALATGSLARADGLDRLQLRLNGNVSVVGAYVDQSNMDGLDQGVFAVDSAILGSAVLPLEGGDEIGLRAAVGLDYASNFDSMINDAGSTNVLDELWIYGEFGFGRVQAGLDDGVARIMGLGIPQVSRANRLDNPEIYLLAFPCSTLCKSDSQFPGSLFSPHGMQLRTDIHSSDDYNKLIYMSPIFDGFRFGVSFAPDGTRDPGQLFGADEINEQGNIWDFAASFVKTFGEVDFGVSAGYVTGENVNNLSPGFFGDVQDYGGAIRLGYREWNFGAAYRRTNVAGGGPIVQGFGANVFDDLFTEIWSVGLTYERGPWMAGVTYIAANEEVPFDNDQDGEGVQLAAGYTFTDYLRLTGGWQHFNFDGPRGQCVTGTGGIFFPECDTLDANLGYVETTFSF